MAFGWIASLFKPAERHGIDPPDGEPTDAECEAVFGWMAAKDINNEDFGLTHFKRAPFLAKGASLVAIGEGNTRSDAPVGFFVELREAEVLTSGLLPHGHFAKAQHLAEAAYDEGRTLSDQLAQDAITA